MNPLPSFLATNIPINPHARPVTQIPTEEQEERNLLKIVRKNLQAKQLNVMNDNFHDALELVRNKWKNIARVSEKTRTISIEISDYNSNLSSLRKVTTRFSQ